MDKKPNDKYKTKRTTTVSSNSLFHFTGSINTIKTILEKRFFWPRYSTQYSWSGYNFAIPVVCFCDIPLSRITDHIAYYGNYGFGMKKTWAKDNKLTPVFYMQNNSALFNKISYAIKKMFESGNISQFEDEALWLYLIKKASGIDYKIDKENGVGAESHELFVKSQRKFYDEREWRYIPSLQSYADSIKFSKEKFTKDELDEFSQVSLRNLLPFNFNDIQYIIVDTEKDRKELITYIRKKQNDWDITDADLFLLISKIISCVQIKYDF